MRQRFYPAPPEHFAPDPTDLEEGVLALLEDAGMQPADSDPIMKLIDQWQKKRAADLDEDAINQVSEGERP